MGTSGWGVFGRSARDRDAAAGEAVLPSGTRRVQVAGHLVGRAVATARTADTVAARAAVRRALGWERRLAQAVLARVARVEAVLRLRARLADWGIGGVLLIAARRSELDRHGGLVGERDRAAAEAIAAIRSQAGAGVQALLGLHRRAVLEGGIVRALRCARVLGIALQVPLALVVALTAVAVEEAVLLAGVDVVAGDPCLKGFFVVIEGSDALDVPRVDPAVAVVV